MSSPSLQRPTSLAGWLPGLAHSRKWLSNWSLPPATRIGLLASAVMIGVGLHKGINLLVLVGYCFPVLVTWNAVAATRGMPQITVCRRFGGPLFAAAPVGLELHIHNVSSTVSGANQLEEAGAHHRLTWNVPPLAPGETLCLRGKLLLPSRGEYLAGPISAMNDYPFGMVERRIRALPSERWLVLPKLGSLNMTALNRLLRGRDERSDNARTNPQRGPAARDEFHGLRPFRDGDSPRTIHWRTSARRNELMVREYEDFTAESLMVLFDAGALGAAEDGLRRFERAVSLAATVVWQWRRHYGGRFAFVHLGTIADVFDSVTEPDVTQRALESLALSEPTRPIAADTMAAALAALKWQAGSALLVTPRANPPVAAVEAALRQPVSVLSVGSAVVDEIFPTARGSGDR